MLQDKMDSLPKKVTIKFNISQKNPEYNFIGGTAAIDSEVDMSQTTGPQRIYPACWDLQPVTFRIKDPGAKKRIKIGIVTEENPQGDPIGFKRIRLLEHERGIKILNQENPDDEDELALILLHPALKGGMFFDADYPEIMEIVNLAADAKTRNLKRNHKTDAMYVAANMNHKEIKDFACAMGWDENEDVDVLQDKISEMAEKQTDKFKVFIESSMYHHRAEITRAEKAGHIVWIPMENKYTWADGQLIAAFGKQEGPADRLKLITEWISSHRNGEDVFKRIKGLNRPEKKGKSKELVDAEPNGDEEPQQ